MESKHYLKTMSALFGLPSNGLIEVNHDMPQYANLK